MPRDAASASGPLPLPALAFNKWMACTADRAHAHPLSCLQVQHLFCQHLLGQCMVRELRVSAQQAQQGAAEALAAAGRLSAARALAKKHSLRELAEAAAEVRPRPALAAAS